MVAGPRTKTPKSNPGEWSCDPFPVQQFTAINEHLTSHFQKLSLLNGPKKWDIAEKKMRGRKKKKEDIRRPICRPPLSPWAPPETLCLMPMMQLPLTLHSATVIKIT